MPNEGGDPKPTQPTGETTNAPAAETTKVDGQTVATEVPSGEAKKE